MSQLLAPLLWSVVPGQVTQALLPPLSAALPRLLPPAPPNTPQYQRNYRHVITALTLSWLLYAFLNHKPEQDWYDLLRVLPTSTDDELRKAFRTLSRTYHPDRQPNPAAAAAASEHFILLRRAYETLTTPARRFAYDRFGPVSAKWLAQDDKASIKQLMWAGAQSSLGFYVTSGLFMLLLALSGRAQGGYWRNVLLLGLLVVEAGLILAPTSSRPAYIRVAMLRRLGADTGVAISQLAGVWSGVAQSAEAAALGIASHLHGFLLGELADVLEPVVDEVDELQEGIEDVVLGLGHEMKRNRVGVDRWGVVVAEPPSQLDDLMDIAVRMPLPPTPPPEPRRSARLA